MNLKVSFSEINHKMNNPAVFLIFSAALQLVLLFINIGNYNIISGELTDKGRTIVHILFIAELALLFLSGIIPAVLLVLKKKISVAIQILLLILPVVYLFIFCVNIYKAIPASVWTWIMPVERIVFYQFIFIMPVVFYSVVWIASFQSRFSVKQEVFASLILLAAPPFFTYLAYNIIHNIFRPVIDINDYILPVFVIIATAVMFLAVIRLLLILHHSLADRNRFIELIIYFTVGLIMPLGGLVLNKFIPFPTDFQSIPIYCLAVLNGIFLMMPDMKNKSVNVSAALVRFALFPFTLYFFFVFLPFLPLSIPVILVFGAGFLIMAPVLLFILHVKKLTADFKNNIPFRNFKKKIAACAVSLLIIPGIIIINGLLDKMSISQALEYVYEPDYSEMNAFKGSRRFVRHGLESLERKKAGIYLPFISGFYDWLVFDNLVLSDSKMNYMHRAFFGRVMEQAERNDSPFSLLLGRNLNNRVQPVSRNFTPSKDVVITKISHISKHQNNFIRTSVKIHMKNLTNFQQEFRTSISVPEGVFVSNYWLHIGKERVQGRIFEKKSAMWIYQMIRSERRDPGLLYFENPGLLHLSVFPFSGSEERITEIEFLYPDNLSPEIETGDGKFRFNDAGKTSDNMIAVKNEDRLSVLISEQIKTKLPKTRRTPYLHFLVDWSGNSGYADTDFIENIKNILREFPENKYCSITLANYESADITGAIIPVEQLNNTYTKRAHNILKTRGGFCRDRAIKSILINYEQQSKRSLPNDQYFLYSPVIFVLKDPQSELLKEDDFYYFSKLSPDVKYYYTYENNKIQVYDFNGNINSSIKRIVPEQVIIVKLDGDIFYTGADRNDLVHNNTTSIFLSMEVFNPEYGRFQLLGSVNYINKDKPYAKAMQADMLCREKFLNPSLSSGLFKPVVMMSKETGIMNQATSYIVVENSAQWKMLEQMEKKKLNNKESMETVNTPEPSLIIIGGIFLIFIIFRNICRKITINKESI